MEKSIDKFRVLSQVEADTNIDKDTQKTIIKDEKEKEEN
jgi:hypothetical protein